MFKQPSLNEHFQNNLNPSRKRCLVGVLCTFCVDLRSTNKYVTSLFIRTNEQRNKQTNINPLNTELNPICHLLALLGAHHIHHISGVRVKGHFNPLNAQLNPICHLLALLGAHHILHVRRISVKGHFNPLNAQLNPICHLLALLAQHILHVSRIRVKPN